MEDENTISDNFGRIHNYLRISLTDRCNLRCFYCMPENGIELTEKDNIMSIEEIIAISKIFVDMGVNKIRLTGGEPLIRKNIEKLLDELSKLPVKLKLTTNGILVDKYVEIFKKTGLNDINVSLDSLDKEKNLLITKRDYFDKVIENINLLDKEKFNLKINVVLVKNLNDNEIENFIALTESKNINVKFIEFMPFKDNNWDWSKGVSKVEILETVSQKFENIIKLEDGKNSTSQNFKIENFKGQFSIISTVTNPFCDTCNRIRLTANGKIKNCLFSGEETDILQAFRKGKNIKPIIIEALQKKKYSRAGMSTFDTFSNPENNSKNRSMVAIGG